MQSRSKYSISPSAGDFLTGLPFVFAFWAVRDGFKDAGFVDTLKASRDFGVANIPTIAEKYSEPLRIKKEFIQSYLEHNVHYYMDQACIEGLHAVLRESRKNRSDKSLLGACNSYEKYRTQYLDRLLKAERQFG